MTTKITVNYTHRPDGSVVYITGLGEFENGQEHEVDMTQEEFDEHYPSTTFGSEFVTKSDLYERAQELDISGRSKMTEAELEVAITEAEQGDDE